MKKILIVDDEEDMVWSLQKNLRNDTLNVDVLTAQSAEEALDVLNETPVDLMITDIRMPGMSGIDLLVQVKKQYPHTGVIVMTAYPSPDFRKDAAYKGCLYFIEKPFDINNFREVVRNFLEEEKGFKGTVTGIELTDIIQINCLSRTTSALRVKMADREGIIFFKEGRVVHAICENLEGEEAFYEMLGFEGGTLESMKGSESPDSSINSGWESLLLEGLRRIDEKKKNEFNEIININTSDEQKNIATREERMNDLQEVLKEFTSIDGVNVACLVERDGFIIDSIAPTGVDTDVIGAISSTGLGSSESMGRQLAKGALIMTMVEYEDGSIFVSPAGENAFLVIVSEQSANLGMIRVKTKKFKDKLPFLTSI